MGSGLKCSQWVCAGACAPYVLSERVRMVVYKGVGRFGEMHGFGQIYEKSRSISEKVIVFWGGCWRPFSLKIGWGIQNE